MTSDDRLTWNTFFDILGVLEHHGYRRSDNYQIREVIRAVSALTRTYEGTVDRAQLQPAGSGTEAAQNTVVVSGAETITLFAALDIAADHKRYRVEMCPDCADRSCPTCRICVQDAEAFDQLADRMLEAAKTAPATHHGQVKPPDRPSQPNVAADKEAGQ